MKKWGSSVNSKGYYLLVLILLLGLLLFPWVDQITPAVNPLRFLSKLPFPAGNVLFACYIVVIYLNLHQLIYQQINKKTALFRFCIAWGAMAAILQISNISGLNISWTITFAWLALCLSAVGELLFLYHAPDKPASNNHP